MPDAAATLRPIMNAIQHQIHEALHVDTRDPGCAFCRQQSLHEFVRRELIATGRAPSPDGIPGAER